MKISDLTVKLRFYMEMKPTSVYKHSKSILYYKHNKPPPCTSFDRTCGLPPEGALRRIYHRNFQNQLWPTHVPYM